MDKYDEMSDKIDSRVEAAILATGKKSQDIHVSYSAYDCDADDNPIDNLDDVAIEGKALIMREADEFYGGDESNEYISPVVENPTWLQLAVLANDMIETVNDHHHVFLEGVEKLDRAFNGVPAYRFVMGS